MAYAPSSPEKPELHAAFVERCKQYPALEELPRVLTETQPEVSVRLNRAKHPAEPSAERVPWCEDGYYMPQRPRFTLDPALHQGRYYVQDASSMVLSHIAAALTADGRPVRWLDACAAPGGKTTAILSQLPQESVMVANEYEPRRVAALSENLMRHGNPWTVITRGDTEQFGRLDGFFDVISVDAPCSGEGMMRKDATAVAQWNPGLVEQCAALQRQIVDNVWPALRPGGTLVYSTCTFNTAENEDNVQHFADTYGAQVVDMGLTQFQGVQGAVTGQLPVARFIPGHIRGEGLFVAVLRKPGNAPAAHIPTPKAAKKAKKDTVPPVCAGWLNCTMRLALFGDSVWGVPAPMAPLVDRLTALCSVVSAGIHVATVKGRDTLPATALARSTAYRPDAFPAMEVDTETAVNYLRGNAIAPVDGTPRGLVAVTWQGQPLGFAKNLGNRLNTLLEQRYRIQNK